MDEAAVRSLPKEMNREGKLSIPHSEVSKKQVTFNTKK